MNNWGGVRQNCGRKKREKEEPLKKARSEELEARMKRNTEINDKFLAKQPKGKVKPRFGLGNTNTYYEGGF